MTDFVAFKERQQQAWSTGDFVIIARRILGRPWGAIPRCDRCKPKAYFCHPPSTLDSARTGGARFGAGGTAQQGNCPAPGH